MFWYNVISHNSSYYFKMYISKIKTLHIDVYSSFIHNFQNLEATKMSFSR